MAPWLQSGRRRDVCAIVADEGECTGQHCKTRLQRHYDQRIDPDNFRRAMNALVDAGVLEREADGLADAYSLTPEGEARLAAHVEWLTATVPDDLGDADDDGSATG